MPPEAALANALTSVLLMPSSAQAPIQQLLQYAMQLQIEVIRWIQSQKGSEGEQKTGVIAFLQQLPQFFAFLGLCRNQLASLQQVFDNDESMLLSLVLANVCKRLLSIPANGDATALAIRKHLKEYYSQIMRFIPNHIFARGVEERLQHAELRLLREQVRIWHQQSWQQQIKNSAPIVIIEIHYMILQAIELVRVFADECVDENSRPSAPVLNELVATALTLHHVQPATSSISFSIILGQNFIDFLFGSNMSSLDLGVSSAVLASELSLLERAFVQARDGSTKENLFVPLDVYSSMTENLPLVKAVRELSTSMMPKMLLDSAADALRGEPSLQNQRFALFALSLVSDVFNSLDMDPLKLSQAIREQLPCGDELSLLTCGLPKCGFDADVPTLFSAISHWYENAIRLFSQHDMHFWVTAWLLTCIPAVKRAVLRCIRIVLDAISKSRQFCEEPSFQHISAYLLFIFCGIVPQPGQTSQLAAFLCDVGSATDVKDINKLMQLEEYGSLGQMLRFAVICVHSMRIKKTAMFSKARNLLLDQIEADAASPTMESASQQQEVDSQIQAIHDLAHLWIIELVEQCYSIQPDASAFNLLTTIQRWASSAKGNMSATSSPNASQQPLSQTTEDNEQRLHRLRTLFQRYQKWWDFILAQNVFKDSKFISKIEEKRHTIEQELLSGGGTSAPLATQDMT